MLEEGPWPHQSKGPFFSSRAGDPNLRPSCSASDDDRTSNHCISGNMDSICSDSCVDDSILGDQPTAVDNNLFYQLNNANEDDLDLLDNNLQDKEHNDILYYGWPEIENFEEVDRMFRSCDSTFGLDIDNGDELGWFSSSHEIEGSEDVLKSSFDFPGCDQNTVNYASQHQNVYGLDDICILKNEIDQRVTLGGLKGSSQELNPNCSLVVNGSGTDNHIDYDLQTQSCVSQSKQQKPSEDKIKEMSFDNEDTLSQLGILKQLGESSKLLDFQSNISAEHHEQQKHTHQISFQVPSSHINGHPSDQVLVSPGPPLIKSNTDLPSVSLSKSNEMQCAESSHEISFQNPVSANKKKDRIHQRKSSGHTGKRKLIQKADPEPISSQKQISNVENEIEGLSEVSGRNFGIPGEIDTSYIQESSCMSSVMDEVSIEATSFRQLQKVMEQLDVRTKLCIRDSLYRLARSAEQRHKCVSQISEGRDNNDASGPLISDETDKCTGLMDVETDTNPIDRSIAHLLFHRPSDPSTVAALDAGHTRSYPMVHTRQIGPVMAEKLVSLEAAAPATNEAEEE